MEEAAEEKNNLCTECGYEGVEGPGAGTCPECGGEMVSKEKTSGSEQSPEGEGEEVAEATEEEGSL